MAKHPTQVVAECGVQCGLESTQDMGCEVNHGSGEMLLLLIESQSKRFWSTLNYNSSKTRLVMRNLAVAVRALDPPEGGAERSLAALVGGLLNPGPAYGESTVFLPFSPVEGMAETSDAWGVSVIQGAVNSNSEPILDKRVIKEVCGIETESILSGLAWRLRSKTTGYPNDSLRRIHLKRANAKFAKAVGRWLDESPTKPEMGLTQLSWSSGAAEAFSIRGVPYVLFIRDELPFRFPDVFSDAIEGAACVCAAGNGLGRQIQDSFKVSKIENVPLPIDYRSRFGDGEKVEAALRSGRLARADDGTSEVPRFAIIGIVPSTGLSTYKRLFPHLARNWPEATFDLYGSGLYINELAEHPNVTVRGFIPVEDIFSLCDVHVRIHERFGTWGRVTNEAGIFRVPTVSNSVGSQPEAVGRGGVVVNDHHNVEEFERALRKCWEERATLGEMAYEHSRVSDHRRSVSILRSILDRL